MRTAFAMLAGAVIAIWIGSACLVDRRSDALACSQPTDCSSPRVCEGGYCVIDPDACPSQCNSCDVSVTPHVCRVVDPGSNFTCPSNVICMITCDSPSGCNDITCSGGSTCTITCTADSACNDVTCSGDSCSVTCEGTNACQNVTCGNNHGRCNLHCDGTNACRSVACTGACACDVDCPTGDCSSISCPKANSAKYCTASGNNDNEPCTSSLPNCDSC